MEYWLFAAGTAVLVWTWLLVRKGYVTGWARLEASRKQLEEQATELAVVAEEVLADLSERTERLRQLIAQADTVLGKAPPAESVHPAVAVASAAAPAAAAPPAVAAAAGPTLRAPVYADTLFDSEPVPPALALLSALEAAAAEAPAVTAPPGMAPRRAPAFPPGHQIVWDLAEQGEPVTEIARRLQKTQGEVELILGLRRLG